MASPACLSTHRTLLALTALAAVACSFPDRTFDDNAFYATPGGSGGVSGSPQGGRSGSSQGGAGTSPVGGGTNEAGGNAGSAQGGQAGSEVGGNAGGEQGGDAGTAGTTGGTAGTNGGSAGTSAGKGGAAGTSGSSGQGGAGTAGSTAGKGGSAGTTGGTAGTAGKGGSAGASGSSGQGGTAGTSGSSGTGGCGTGAPGALCTSNCQCGSGQLCNSVNTGAESAACGLNGSATGKELGEGCAANSDCKSRLCDFYAKTCALFCASDGDCGAANACISSPYGQDADNKIWSLNECFKRCSRNADCPSNGGTKGGLCTLDRDSFSKTFLGICNWVGEDPPGSKNNLFAFGQSFDPTTGFCDSGASLSVKVGTVTTTYCTRFCTSTTDCGGTLNDCQPLPFQGTDNGITYSATLTVCVPAQ